MCSRSIKGIIVMMLVFCFAMVTFGQDKVVTKKEVVVNPDGSYTVIEYPVGKEVTVNLLPSATIKGGKGIARVIRAADGTKVFFDVSDLPASANSYYAYAVDPSGTPTLLGPITVENGVGKGEFATTLNQFMLVLSPNEGLTGITPANVVFTSDIPTGYAVVPKRVSETRTAQVAGDVRLAYDVPLLNISTFGEKEKEVKLKFSGELTGLEAKAYITRKKGATKVRMQFDDMTKVPPNKRFTLWASSPDGQYTKLGQVVNSKNKDEARIQSETELTDFGLFITAEDADVGTPTSRIYSVFTVPAPQ
jgi:hypothetical protein